MRIISAPIIYDGLGNSLQNYAVMVKDNAVIVELVPIDLISEKANIECYRGSICPGFVNVHCHLELSHLKHKLTEATGINSFLNELLQLRQQDEEHILECAHTADKEMFVNGIVLVGDICNTPLTIGVKQKSKITYHNFVELFALSPDRATIAFEKGQNLLQAFKQKLPEQKTTLTPHAPYSVSEKLFGLINSSLDKTDVITVHNQESESENQFFNELKGPMVDRLIQWGIDLSHLAPTGNSSIKSYFGLLRNSNPKLLIHNTFIDESDLDFLMQTQQKIYFGLCPNANWYIERKLPPINLLKNVTDAICIGTDSLASNYSLNVYEELLFLKLNFPELMWEELIKWATYNGAKALGYDEVYGSISPGRRPGLINITPEKTIKRII